MKSKMGTVKQSKKLLSIIFYLTKLKWIVYVSFLDTDLHYYMELNEFPINNIIKIHWFVKENQLSNSHF